MRFVSNVSIVLATVSLLAACGGGGSSKKGQSGSKATSMKGMATQKGSQQDGIVCDASTEGEGFCADDFTIVFCSDNVWWALDCSAFDAVCDYSDGLVDCY